MRRRRAAKTLPSDSSDDDLPLSRVGNGKPKKAKVTNDDDSSSESDIENYLQRADKIDLNSPFFDVQKNNAPSFDKIENEILAGVSTLTDSESETEASPQELAEAAPSTSRLNFSQLHEYTRKLEEAKRHVEEYNARKHKRDKELDVENLLAAGESKNDEKVETYLNSSEFESCSDSEKEGWEEVAEEEKDKEKSVVPKEGLEITVEMPGAVRKKKGVDLIASIKRRINRVRKENQLLIHKVHLLCWLAHGNYVSSTINSQNVLAVALSLLPSQQCYPANRTDLNYLEQVLKWYRNAVTNVEKPPPLNKTLEELLQTQITKKEAYNKTMLVYIFVAILRSLGIQCRLVLSLQVEPLRPPSSELHSLSTKNEDTEKKKRSKSTSETKLKVEEVKSRSKSASEVEKPKTSKKDLPKPKAVEVKTRSSEIAKPKTSKKDLPKPKAVEVKSRSTEAEKPKPGKKELPGTSRGDESKPKAKERAKSTSSEKSKPKPKQVIKIKLPKSKKEQTESVSVRNLRSKKPSIPQLDGANDPKSPTKPNLRKLKQKEPPCPVKTHPKRLKKVTKYRDSDSEDDFTTRSPFSNKNNDSPQSKGPNLRKLKQVKSGDVRNDIVHLVKKSIKEQKDLDKSKRVRKRNESENDSDYAPVVTKKRRESEDEFSPKIKVKRRVQVKPEEDEKVKKKKGVDVWVEVFLETEEKWISVDVVKGQVHCVNELYTRASHPVAYVVAWNNDNTLKDITKRYCTNFNTVTRKLRIDAKWWEESLKPFIGRKGPRDKEEDEELERQQLEKPLPTSISEYKNHPLYALKRHLLKFEGIYPPDAPTLGFVRNEPVYSRQCVYTLHSRDIWLKQAKVVKPGEQPYKIVKARPKWDKLSNSVITDQLLEIFGPWQTMEYEPPTAENGVVPRNAFGNVELFKTCMLPKKTVHLKLPGLNKVARRMNIDCASAIVGFDFHGGWSHPTYDGFVVCEEFADVLVAAWDLDQEEQEKKEQEKIDKRVYGNWRRIIRGLLIRERLKAKYEFGEPSGEKGKKKGAKLVKKKNVESGSESD